MLLIGTFGCWYLYENIETDRSVVTVVVEKKKRKAREYPLVVNIGEKSNTKTGLSKKAKEMTEGVTQDKIGGSVVAPTENTNIKK